MNAQAIQQAVAHYYAIRLEDLLSAKRNKRYAYPRMVAIYACRKLLKLSYPQLGRAFARHHTTCMYAVETIHRLRRNVMPLMDELEATRKAPDCPPTMLPSRIGL